MLTGGSLFLIRERLILDRDDVFLYRVIGRRRSHPSRHEAFVE